MDRRLDLTVLIGPSSFGDVDREPVRLLEQAGLRVVPNPYGRRLTREELQRLLPGVVGLIAGLEPLTRDVLKRSNLRVISRCGAGLSNVDIEAAKDLGIVVTSTPDAPTESVAELTVGAMISLLHRMPQMDRALHEGQWTKQIGLQLQGKAVALVGFGRIGRRVAELLVPFGARIMAVDIERGAPFAGVDFVPLPEALAMADVVSIHASGHKEIISEAEFARMKPGVFLLNAARGGLVNEAALCRVLESGRVAGAWLDAFVEEPYKGPLSRFPQVLLTPHAGSYTTECRLRMERQAVENLLNAMRTLGSVSGG